MLIHTEPNFEYNEKALDFTRRPFLKPYDYYKQRLQPLWPIVQDMANKGMRIDQPTLEKFKLNAEQDWVLRNEKLQAKLGYIPNTRSYIDMGKMFEHLGIESFKTLTGRASSKEAHILMYAQRYPEARETLLDCLEIQGDRQLLSQFLAPAVDELGFYHPLYILNATTTGRFAGKAALEGGPQPQNWPKMIRKMACADSPQHVFIQADLKQAEAMIVSWISNDQLLIDAFTRGKDVHRVRGCVCFRNWRDSKVPPDELLDSILLVCPACKLKGESECKESERQIAKIVGHSSNYEVGARKMATEVLPKAGLFLSELEVKKIQEVIISKAVREWWKFSKERLKRSPIVYNAAGRFRELYGQLDNEMVRDYLAWQAQSVVGDITNAAMLRLYYMFKAKPSMDARIVTQTHDSLLVCCLRIARFEVEEMLTKAFHHVLLFGSKLERVLTIPIDLAHGDNWGDQHENKKCAKYSCEYAMAA